MSGRYYGAHMPHEEVRVCVSGLGLLESPRWSGGAVWFADWTAGKMHRYDVSRGTSEVVAQVDSLPLCFDLSGPDLFVLDSQHGQLLRKTVTGALSKWIDVQDLSSGGGNEVLVSGDLVYLNFGNFDPRQGFPTEPVGLIASIDADGRTRVLADAVDFPNGMAITSDRRELVVAESHAGRLTAWTINSDGALSDRRLWADLGDAAPDGISMAPDGTCWYADVPAHQVTRVAEGGAVLDRVQLDRGAFSCVLAPELNTLFVTAAHWPGGHRMFDPSHDWDGQLIAIQLP